MTIEKAVRQNVDKPWGSTERGRWAGHCNNHKMVGETWFERPDVVDTEPKLLVKLLYTSQRLSIQVHPNDTSAQAMGLPHGKTEAWYVLAAAPGSEVAVGLKREITNAELRKSIVDGSIEALIAWRPVQVGEFVFVPAGTIHAIGAGLVLAEIQQRSNTTFRLFDYGRGRELQIESALSVARTEITPPQSCSLRLSRVRTLLLANPHFVVEHLDLPAYSAWQLFAQHETWLLGLGGDAIVADVDLATSEAVYLETQHATLHVGGSGLQVLVAYVGGAVDPMLLTDLETHIAAPSPACLSQFSRQRTSPFAIASAPRDVR